MLAAKVGGPIPEETFDQLFSCVHTMEKREEQYKVVAEDRKEPHQKSSNLHSTS